MAVMTSDEVTVYCLLHWIAILHLPLCYGKFGTLFRLSFHILIITSFAALLCIVSTAGIATQHMWQAAQHTVTIMIAAALANAEEQFDSVSSISALLHVQQGVSLYFRTCST